MSSISVAGDTSGSITLSAPAVSGSSVLTLPVATDTLVGKATTDTLTNKTLTAPAISSAVLTTMASSVITSGTAVASTSGTSIDFTGIPSWVKRITVMFNGVSTNGASNYLIQLGTGGTPATTGYVSAAGRVYTTTSTQTSTAGFIMGWDNAAFVSQGILTFANLSGNTWVGSGTVSSSVSTAMSISLGGTVSLGGVLNMVRITTVNGTDTFDAGSINILYE